MFGRHCAVIALSTLLALSAAWAQEGVSAPSAVSSTPSDTAPGRVKPDAAPKRIPDWLNPSLPLHMRLGAAAEERARHKVRYDGSYVKLKYPGGDVPASQGVCTDEVVRTFRMVGIDLQQKVHEDMTAAFDTYPDKFKRKKPDPNIDHRLVYNLHHFFNRHAEIVPPSEDPKDYRPGDVIVWDLDNHQLHVGMVTRKKSKDGQRHLIMHNIAAGPKIEDKLFYFPVIGHYRYDGTSVLASQAEAGEGDTPDRKADQPQR